MRTGFVCLGLEVALLSAALTASAASPTSGDLYYTRWAGNVGLARAHYSFDGALLDVGERQDLCLLAGADGVVFAPDGDVMVGGAIANVLYKVHLSKKGVEIESRDTAGMGAFHLAIDPDLSRLWAGEIPGSLLEFSLQPFSDGVIRPVQGDDTEITGIAFDQDGIAYYTVSDQFGGGNLGRIDLTTFTTTRALSGLPAAHGIVFDPYTNHLILSGAKHITQVDPVTLSVVSDLDLSANPALNTGAPAIDTIDQGSADGNGHVFAAVNNGWLIFVDMSASKKVGDADNVLDTVYLDDYIDDIAPLSWLGSPKKPRGPKSPNSPTSGAGAH